MRLASYVHGGETRLGVVDGTTFVDVNRAAGAPVRIVDFLAAGEAALRAARHALDIVRAGKPDALRRDGLVVDRAAVQLLPPVPIPPKFYCVGRNYREHAAEGGSAPPETPVIFVRFPDSFVADGQPIIRPHVSDQLDFEGELAVVIGRSGRYLSPDDAFDVVAGYSIFNDGTLRDYQQRSVQWTAGKNFYHTGPFGPYLVLKDEVPDPQVLDLTTRVNGEVMQHANTRDMIFDIPTLIAHVSEFLPVQPGDVIATGTPSGVGHFRKPPVYLKPGDVVSVEIEGIGRLENPVADE